MPTLYQSLISAGVPTDHHESDLYFPATPGALAILAQYPAEQAISTRFSHRVDGTSWVEVPFAYNPYWDAKLKTQGV